MSSVAVNRVKNAQTDINLPWVRGLIEDMCAFLLKCVDECVIISGCG